MLKDQQIKLMEHKEHLVGEKGIHFGVLIALIFLLAGVLGWEAGRKKWSSRIGQQLLEAGTLFFMNYFKRLVMP